MRINGLILMGVCFALIVFFLSASAFNVDDLRALQETGSCPNGYLAGVDLRNTDLDDVDLRNKD